MSSSDTDRVVSVTLTHVALALQPVLYYTVTPRTHALALPLGLLVAVPRARANHTYTYGHATNRVAGAQEKTTSTLVSLACTKRRCAVRVSASQGRSCRPARLLATKPTVRVRVHRSAGENRAHLLHVQFFLYLYDVAKTTRWIVCWAAGSRSE